MGRGQLWDGSQSNYKKQCNPSFPGGTKFIFQWSPFFPLPQCLLPSLLLCTTHFYIHTYKYKYIFLYIFPHRSHSRHTPFPQLHDFLGCMKACIGLCHQQSIKAFHPSCVMLRSAGSLKHPTSSVSLTMRCTPLLQRGCSQRSPHTSALPLETKGIEQIILRTQMHTLLLGKVDYFFM